MRTGSWGNIGARKDEYEEFSQAAMKFYKSRRWKNVVHVASRGEGKGAFKI